MRLVVTYFTGGISYSVPNDLTLTYAIVQLRFLFFSFLITYYLAVPYTVAIMVIAVLLADFRFYLDFGYYIESINGNYDNFDNEDDDDF